MLNCLFYSLFFVSFLNLSFGSLKMSQLNRAFLSSYKGMFEASVVTVGNDGEPIYPYFNQTILNNYVNDFIGSKISSIVSDYSLSLNFYMKDGVTYCPPDSYSRNVKIRLNAKINFLFNYDKEKSFSISDRSSI